MSLRTPLRSRASVGNLASGSSFQNPAATPQDKISLSDFKRPPSAMSARPGSPRSTPYSSRSRPSSSLGLRSRPSTPSFRPEPYTGSISVSIRPNPYTFDRNSTWHIEEDTNAIMNVQDASVYSFDNVFGVHTGVTNTLVYERSCAKLIQKFLNEGYNSTVFAYGMTGSGKTFSMKGSNEDPGFIQLAVNDIFDRVENDISEKAYTISISYLEIYNEKIIDLLNSGPAIATDLKIRDDPVHGTKIVGLSSPIVNSRSQLLALINRGDSNRKTSETDFNSRSSRSHAILQIRLQVVDLTNATEQNSTLSLCDLAGSERATSSMERRKEGSFINKSLLALSNVINKLSASSANGAINDHIPYRDSKLTRLLQSALSGSSLVAILCTIHMGSITGKIADTTFISETNNTIRFAARAKDIVMSVQKNRANSIGEGESTALVEQLRRTIEQQKNEISILKAGRESTFPKIHVEDHKLTQLLAENRLLTEKVEHLMRLTDLQKTETIILKNETLNDILGSGVDNNSSQSMIANLEEFHKRVNYELEEYRGYITHLEQKLQVALQEGLQNSGFSSKHDLSVKQMECIMKDQEEEILSLKEVVKDKDHFIKSLTKTSKLRRLVDSDSMNSQPIKLNEEKPRLRSNESTSSLSSLRSDKENDSRGRSGLSFVI